jgi:hypothetical protein
VLGDNLADFQQRGNFGKEIIYDLDVVWPILGIFDLVIFSVWWYYLANF